MAGKQNTKKTQKDTSKSALAKKFLNQNASLLSISHSTPSLPDLANISRSSLHLPSRQTLDLSTSMRRGNSEHKNEEVILTAEEPKQKIAKKRRHSFSSFLNAKFGRQANKEERNAFKKVSSSPTDVNPIYSNSFVNGNQNRNIQNGKKGHRPRSYSEVSFNLPHVERAPPVAITNKTPAYEYYGFVMYLASFVGFGIYLIWAYVPDKILHELGITYYPNRYWALAIPIWLMTFVWFIFISYMAINLMNTKPFDSIYTITDEHANLMRMDSELVSDRPSDWMPELYDIPISLVNKILYQDEDINRENPSLSYMISSSNASFSSQAKFNTRYRR